MNWVDFFNMGVYAWYVWSCWALTLIVFLGLLLHTKWQHNTYKKKARRQLQRIKKTNEINKLS